MLVQVEAEVENGGSDAQHQKKGERKGCEFEGEAEVPPAAISRCNALPILLRRNEGLHTLWERTLGEPVVIGRRGDKEVSTEVERLKGLKFGRFEVGIWIRRGLRFCIRE